MTLNVGIIGAGSIVEHAFLPGFAPPSSPQAARALPDWAFDGCPGAKVVLLASRSPEKLARLAGEFGVPSVSTDWREVIDSPKVDAVCIATPNHLHHPMAIAAARAGKHILVEKPMALTMSQALEMVQAAEQAGVVLLVHQNQRFAPAHELAKSIVESGVLGPVLSMRARWSHAGPEYWTTGRWFFSPAEAGHGALFDLGIHKVDLMRFVSSQEIAEVSAFTATLAKQIEVEDYAVASLRFANGALGVVEASWASPPNENSLKLYGTRASLQIGLDSTDALSIEFGTRPEGVDTLLPPGKWREARYIPSVPATSALGGPFRHFVDCITTGRACIASGADNLKSLEAVLAAYESAATRCTVHLPE